jgi:hypothetical protein
MAAQYQDTHDIVLTEDAARAGVTGHNVRYVLAFGLTGIVAAFAALAVYLGYDSVEQRVTSAFSRSPWEALQSLAPYAALVLVGAIGAGLVLGAWNILAGRSENASQRFMRLRVAGQLAAVCVIMAILAISAG